MLQCAAKGQILQKVSLRQAQGNTPLSVRMNGKQAPSVKICFIKKSRGGFKWVLQQLHIF